MSVRAREGELRREPVGAPAGSLLGSYGFRRLLIGQSVSSLGDWVATLAFIAAAFALTNGDQAALWGVGMALGLGAVRLLPGGGRPREFLRRRAPRPALLTGPEPRRRAGPAGRPCRR